MGETGKVLQEARFWMGTLEPSPLTVSAALVNVTHCLSHKLRYYHIRSQKYFLNLLTAPKPHHHCTNHSPSSCHQCPSPNQTPGFNLAPLLPIVIFLNRSPILNPSNSTPKPQLQNSSV